MTPASASHRPPPPLDIAPGPLERVRAAIDEIRAGRMVILVDDEDRENEGDLVMAAEKVTPEAINFMAKHGRGLICLSLTESQVERLQLPMMSTQKWRGSPPLGTAFTVSIEARQGVTTGISAADRARTVAVAIHPDARPEDVVTPGHVFPLRARRGGVLVRAGQTEGSVDLARLAGLTPAGVICEIMNDDGSMARMKDLETFGGQHALRILAIEDLIAYRLQTERLVRRVDEGGMVLDRTGSAWRAIVYETTLEERQILALVKGQPEPGAPILCRMHAGSTLADVFASTVHDGSRRLAESIDRIEQAGAGVIVYLPPRGDLRAELSALQRRPSAAGDEPAPQREILREYGFGAQVLRELGLGRIRLLTSNPRKIAGIRGFGLDVIETVELGAG